MLPPERWGMGLVESPRGVVVHWLRADARGDIADWRVRSGSHALLGALTGVLAGQPITEVPLLLRSLALCQACTDK